MIEWVKTPHHMPHSKIDDEDDHKQQFDNLFDTLITNGEFGFVFFVNNGKLDDVKSLIVESKSHIVLCFSMGKDARWGHRNVCAATRNSEPNAITSVHLLLPPKQLFFQRSTVLIGLCCALASIRVCGYLHARLTTLNRWPQMKVNIIVLNVECELRVVNFFHRRVIVRFRNLIVHTARSLIINALIILHWSDNNFLFFLLPLSLLYISVSESDCLHRSWLTRTHDPFNYQPLYEMSIGIEVIWNRSIELCFGLFETAYFAALLTFNNSTIFPRTFFHVQRITHVHSHDSHAYSTSKYVINMKLGKWCKRTSNFSVRSDKWGSLVGPQNRHSIQPKRKTQ